MDSDPNFKSMSYNSFTGTVNDIYFFNSESGPDIKTFVLNLIAHLAWFASQKHGILLIRFVMIRIFK